MSEVEEQRMLDACKLLNEPIRATARLTWGEVREIRTLAEEGIQQSDIATKFNISRPLCNEIVRGHIWDPDAKLTVGDEMRDRIIGALDTGCRRGEMMKIRNKHVDWRHRWIRILKEHSKTDVARVIPFEQGSRLEKLLDDDGCFSDPTRTCSVKRRLEGTSRASGQRGKRCSLWQTASRRYGWDRVTAWRIETRSRRSISTGMTCGTRRSLVSQTTACRSTNCSCSPGTPTSRRRSAI